MLPYAETVRKKMRIDAVTVLLTTLLADVSGSRADKLANHCQGNSW